MQWLFSARIYLELLCTTVYFCTLFYRTAKSFSFCKIMFCNNFNNYIRTNLYRLSPKNIKEFWAPYSLCCVYTLYTLFHLARNLRQIYRYKTKFWKQGFINFVDIHVFVFKELKGGLKLRLQSLYIKIYAFFIKWRVFLIFR